MHLLVDQTRPVPEFRDDWVLMHELDHLLHPLMGGSDRWLSEGLASHYQNVARARSGSISAGLAWNKLHAGLAQIFPPLGAINGYLSRFADSPKAGGGYFLVLDAFNRSALHVEASPASL